MALAGIAVVPVISIALSGFQTHIFGLPSATESAAFAIMMPADLGIHCPQSPGERRARVALHAGSEGNPGQKPELDGAPLPVKKARGPPHRKGYVSSKRQKMLVGKKVQFLKSLKGKFVPWGPKPWDKPRFTKVCIQTRLKSKQAANSKIINQVVEELRRISGMHPWVVKARHNVAAFGWRKGYPCGVAVSLRGPLMYDFLHRLNTIILPRIRDFEGLIPNSFDNFGNFWMGFENQESFRELDDMIDSRAIVHGFDVGILNNCFTQPAGLALMKKFGFPFGEPRTPKPPKEKKSYVKMRN